MTGSPWPAKVVPFVATTDNQRSWRPIIKPDFAQAANSLGLALVEVGRLADGEAAFRRAIELDPRFTRAINNLANVLADQGRREEAITYFERALKLDPQYCDAHNNMGNALRELGRHAEAIASFERALSIRPEFHEAHNNLGIAWAGQGKYDRALACYQEALRLKPEYWAAHNNLGIVLANQKKYDEALASYRRALDIKPDYAEALNNMGIVLSQQGDYDEAVICFRRAIELKPDYAEAFSNLGITLTERGELDEALASYNEAVRLRENYPDAYMNRALAFLVRGDFERGWREYEWRWKCKDFNPRKFGKPQWGGEPLDGRTVMFHAEQGFGDTFQFVRYVRMVKEQHGGRMIVWCPKPLIPILSQCPYIDQLTVEGEKLPEFDVHLPLLSLPHIFGTTLTTVPAEVPYLFAKPELVEHWRRELSYIDAFRIAINWQGNPRYRGDRHRSIPLEKFAPLAQMPGVRLISLQKGFGSEQIPKLAGKFSVTELGGHVDGAAGAFMDTAAVLKNVDLFVTSDTALAHLAGGLGVRVWMPLPKAADWRWLLLREDCPWYPTMRLFRQKEFGNWEEVFERICRGVEELARAERGPLVADLIDLEARGDREELSRLSGIYAESSELAELRSELKAIYASLERIEADIRRYDDQDLNRAYWRQKERQKEVRRRIDEILRG